MLTPSIMLTVTAAIALNPLGVESSDNLKPLAPQISEAAMSVMQVNDPMVKSQSRQAVQPTVKFGRLITRNTGSQINVRSRPTVNSFIRGYGLAGNTVDILSVRPGLDDGYLWYEVSFDNGVLQGWVREELIDEVQPTPVAPDAVAESVIAFDADIEPSAIEPLAETTPQPHAGDEGSGGGSLDLEYASVEQPWLSSYSFEEVEQPFGNPYTPEQINYFTEIALGSEFGNASQRIRKWNDDIQIRVHGDPTTADREALDNIVEELDSLLNHQTGDGLDIEIVSNHDADQANVDIYFVPHYQFSRYERNYQPGNMGFAYVNWNNDRIYQARILITTEGVTQAERSHLIREELTQSLGLLRDSYEYDDSIFYQGWTSTNSFSELDRTIIQMLYSDAIVPGMNGPQVQHALEQPLTFAEKKSDKR